MSGIIHKVENALHLNKNHGTVGTTGTTHTTHNNGVPEGTAGPHSSRVGNAVDPRVDSDLDSSRGHTGTHTNAPGSGVTGTSGSTTAPHNSSLLNKVDPRVNTTSTTGQYANTNNGVTGSTTHHTGNHHAGNHHAGTVGSGVTGTSGSTTTPHNSSLLNKVDPRVDTTSTTGQYANTNNGVTGSTTHHTASHHSGTVGGISNSTNAGPHDSNVANKLDPRVDSDLDSTGNRHGATTHGGIFGSSGTHATPGSGTSQNTAGPHNSDLANKLDPRVDADLDGSRTFGGNRTRA